MDITIALALTSHPDEELQVTTNVGRFKWQFDNYTDIVGDCEINHVNNYQQILEYLKQKFTLNDDDLSDIKGDYEQWLYEQAEQCCQEFAKTMTVEQFNDLDEWIGFINRPEFTFFEQQIIDMYFHKNHDKFEEINANIVTNLSIIAKNNLR